MKVSEYISKTFSKLGIKHVFMVTGGGAMHLNDSFGNNLSLESIFNHHEQASSLAAEGYARYTNMPALLNVTSGPGGTNAITGVYAAYVDSLPMIIVSGQVKYETTVRSTNLNLRQYGDQELDIEKLVKPITKYACMVTDPKKIRYHIEKAYYLATTGRMGPCWLDIPIDIQGGQVDEKKLIGFNYPKTENYKKIDIKSTCKKILKKINSSFRPVIIVGSGLRMSGKIKEFVSFSNKLDIPIVTAWNAHDAIVDNNKNYIGRPGTIGDRAGNFAVQNSDCILILGSRLNIRQISYNWNSFARKAYKIWVDIDPLELKKPNIKADMPINADLKDLIPKLNSLVKKNENKNHKKWLKWCKVRKRKYKVVRREFWKTKKINPYTFFDSMFKLLKGGEVIISANATPSIAGFQAAIIKKNQRLWANSGCAGMGYDLPAAIGAYFGSKNKQIICLAGDGSIMMNLQELQTIKNYNLPMKIIIFNNNGYVSIYQSQKNHFKREVGGKPRKWFKLSLI